MSRGYFGIGIYHGKTEHNIGVLMRSAHLFGASFVFTVGPRYRRTASDTPHMTRHTPMFNFATVDDLVKHLPLGCPLVGVELDPRAVPLTEYEHRERACYLLGAEDHGLPRSVLDACHDVVQVESLRPESMNVSVAGSLILHHRHTSRRLAHV